MSLARRVLPGESIVAWQPWGTYTDILLDRCDEGIARIAINLRASTTRPCMYLLTLPRAAPR